MGFPRRETQLSTTLTGNGDWFFTGDTDRISVHVRNLEVGGVIETRGSNLEANPGVGNLEVKTNVDFTSAVINGQVMFEHKPGFRWMRFRKVQGGIPELTTIETQEWVDT